jgi:hypothetical protein
LTLRVSNHSGDPVAEQQLARMAKRRLAILRRAEEITEGATSPGYRAPEEVVAAILCV